MDPTDMSVEEIGVKEPKEKRVKAVVNVNLKRALINNS